MGTPSKHPPIGGPVQVSNGRLVLRLLALAWRYRLAALGLIFAQMALLVLALSGLSLTGLGIDVLQHELLPHGKVPNYPLSAQPPAHWSAMRIISAIAAVVLALGGLRFVIERFTTVWKAALVAKIVIHLRSTVYEKLQRLSFRFFDANESSTIINRVTGDVQSVRSFVDGVLVEVLMIALSLTLFLIYMLNIHVMLTICCLATTPVLWVLTATFSRIVKPAYRKNRELFDDTVLALAENVQGVHVVKGFRRQKQEIQKFHRANETVTRHKRWIFWRLSIFSPLIGFVPELNIVVLLVYGGYLYLTDPAFGIGSGMIVFAGLLQQFSAQVGSIAQIANSVQQSLTGAQRVFEVLDTPTDITSPSKPVPMERARGVVTFEDVTFGYEQGGPVLEGVDFTIEPGECVAILGTTGSGKSTLLSLIPRFYDPREGRVTIDGIDIRELELDDLRRNIGVVFQETFLFSCTVAENIAFGRPGATMEQVERAARVAAAHTFIMDLPQQYETLLSEGGVNLSGGQRQRLAIARAVLWEPPILLLDDPTASIDPETEDEILLAMDNARAGRTTFVVAHRLSTLKRADLVLVLDNGRIAQSGTHHQLIGESGHYRHAADLQIADAESRRLLGIGMGVVA